MSASGVSSQAFTGTISEGAGNDPTDEGSAGAQPVGERQIAFVDASALVALADAGDASHAAAVTAYHELVAAGYRFFTTDFMIAEAFDLLRHGPGVDVARSWLRACRIPICPVEERDIAQAKQRVIDDDRPDGLGLADAISLAVMDRLGVNDLFAVDQSVLNAMT